MKKILFCAWITLSLSACNEDFLNLSPETNLTSSTFYKTESHFELALVGVYTQLRGIVSPGHYMDEMRSDNTFFRYYAPNRGPANWVEDIVQWTDQSQTTVVNNRYFSDFQGISRANTILSQLPGADISAQAKEKISGETRFLRAFFYFDLVTHYGGVPLYLEQVVDESSAYQSRASIEEVCQQIISDLEAAAPSLPVATVFPQTGRATRGAAMMLLAKTYMSMPQPNYAKAESALREVIGMNYELLDDYLANFVPSNKNNKESIFDIQYMEGDDGQQNSFIYDMLPKTANTSLATGITVNNVSQGGWNVPNENLIASYENGDKRLKASVKVIEGTLNGGTLYTDPITYLAIHDVGSYTAEPGKVYFPFVAKFLHGPYGKPFNTGQNWPVFRYADALLLLAENLVAQGKNADALPYLNAVRARAGLENLQNATKENVLLERRHELAFENHRWTDLIRNGKAIEVMTAYGEEMKKKYDFLPASAFTITEQRLVYAIPFRETQLNRNLTQNTGY
jgi:hypothetical protein